jgi:hypothetical protein
MGNPRQAIDAFNNLRQQDLILRHRRFNPLKRRIVLLKCELVLLEQGVVLRKRFALGVKQQFRGLR